MDSLLRNVHAVPCQPQYLTNAHGATQSQQHTQLQYRISACIQRRLRFAGRPHSAFLRLIFGQRYAEGGVAGDVLPDDRLIQCAAQQSVGLFDHRTRNAGVRFLVALQHNGGLILERVIEQVQVMCRQIFHCHIAQIGLDIMLNAMEIAGQKRISPVVQTVDLHIFVQQLADGDELLLCSLGLYGRLLRRMKFTNGLLIFNLCDAQICGFIGRKTLINRFGISGTAVTDLVLLSLFSGSHKFTLLVSCT